MRARGGEIELAKVDVDSNQMLAQAFGVQGIPAVKAFRDARIAGEFTGAIPPPGSSSSWTRSLPSEAERLVDAGDEESLRAALEKDPRHAPAAIALARLAIERGDPAEARALLADHAESDFVAGGLLARLELEQASNGGEDGELRTAFAAWDDGDAERALELLQAAIAGRPSRTAT